MDINKKNRSDLKSYFVKNSIPTESNFAELIDGMLNQKDDGIVKLSGDPLSIEAAGELAGLQKVINFYAKFQDANPSWSLQLNPRTDPNTPATAKAGFCVADGQSIPRLFIDKTTGNLGVGTITPQARLTVVGAANISNGSGFANGSNYMSSGSLTIGGINTNYGGGSNWSTNTAALLLETLANTEIAVHDSGQRLTSLMYFEGDAVNRITIGRDMGWGVTPVTITNNLTVNGAITPSAGNSASNGVIFKNNIGGDTTDSAWIRYYARSAELMTLEIGTANDNTDHIAFMPSGNVGIGLNNPLYSLDVSASRGIKLGLEGSGGGQLILANNPNDNKIYLEAFSKDGAGSAAELLLTGKNSGSAPKISLVADVTNITGNMSIGATIPIAKLDIAQAARSGTHPTAIKGLYITGDFGEADGIELRHSNASQGIGFGYNTIYATGSIADQVLQLKPKGASALRILGKANISDGSFTDAVEKHMASGSLTIGGINTNYGGGSNWSTNTAGLLLQTLANTEIAVHDSGQRLTSLMYFEGDAVNRITIGRDMGWGLTPVTIASNLTANGELYAGNSDVYFSKTDHKHSGIGNTSGMAAIENAKNYDCLMILGRSTTSGRKVAVWDHFTVNGTFVNSSDRNAKKDIEELHYGLEAVRQLRPVSFNWKKIHNPHKSLGLIAQDVQEVISDVVYEDDGGAHKGALSVSYISLIPVLINAIKELDAKINR